MSEYRGYGRPRATDVMPPKPLGKRVVKQMMRLAEIRRKFGLDPMLALTPRETREQLSVRIARRTKLDHPAPIERKRVDNDTSPQWVRVLRAAYCDHFIKTGELDAEMAGQLRAYADARRQADANSRGVSAAQETSRHGRSPTALRHGRDRDDPEDRDVAPE